MPITIEQATQALDEVNQACVSDFREQLCALSLGTVEGERVSVTGKVLDGETLAQARQALAEKLPGAALDYSGVSVLRQGAPVTLRVGTNMTHLHREPSWLSEMLSQVFNGWPLEVLEEQGRWARARQSDGYLGWVYRPYLSEDAVPEPTHVVSEPVSLLHAEPAGSAALAGKVFGGTAFCPAETRGGWTRLALAGGISGWVVASHLRELASLPQDPTLLRSQLVADAQRMTGTPYLWGGCCANGIDCSGLAQLAHRLVGITIPRDADQQYRDGRPVEPPYTPGDLLFFGETGEWRAITHVGISLGGWDIIHSSRSRNGVYMDNVQAVPHLKESFAGARSFFAAG